NEPQPNGKVTAVATDAAGNKSAPTTVDYVADAKNDTTPPDAPTDVVAVTKSNGGVTVSGKAEANSTVTVTTPDGKSHNVRVDGNGNFKLDVNEPQPNGKVTAVATDAAGNKSAPTTVDYVADAKNDTTPPDAPANVVAVTKFNGGIVITGTAEPNSTVRLKLPNGTIVSTTAGGDGQFKAEVDKYQTDGNVTATATDAAGNTSLPTVVSYKVDSGLIIDIPAPPTGVVVTTKTNGGINVRGNAEKDSTVTLVAPDGNTYTTKADSEGRFTVDINKPQPNGNVTATATNDVGIVSPTTVVAYKADSTIDTTAPNAPTDLLAVTKSNGGVIFSGKAEAHSTVTVTTADGKSYVTKADQNGQFSVDIDTPQRNGNITATASDAAGNVSAPAILPYVADPGLDTSSPDAPTDLVALAKPNGGITVSGNAEKNSTVKITAPDGTVHTATTDLQGHFSVDIPTAQPNGKVSAVAVDAAGNQSLPATLTYNGVSPAAPTYDITTDPTTGEVTVAGKAGPGLKVRVVFPDNVTKLVTADENGNFTVSGPAPQQSGQFKAVAIDEMNRESPATIKDYSNPNATYKVTVESYTDTVGSDGQKLENDKYERYNPSVPTNDPAPTLHGRTKGAGAGDKIEILNKSDASLVASGDINSDGTWSIKLPQRVDGVYDYQVRIVDTTRTVKGESVDVRLTIDTVAPSAPTLDKVVTSDAVDIKSGKATVDNTPTLSGRAEANATVIVYHKNTDGKNVEITRVVAGDNGEWTAKLPFQTNRQHDYFVKALDSASNLSPASNSLQITFNGPTDRPLDIEGSTGVWSVDTAGNVDGSGFDSVAGLGYDNGNYNALLKGAANISSARPPEYQKGYIARGFHNAGVGDTNGDGLNDIASVHSGTNSRSLGKS
ncbi:Ig-like domain-containing protein, partial [Pseudomonas sp. SDO5511_1_S431]